MTHVSSPELHASCPMATPLHAPSLSRAPFSRLPTESRHTYCDAAKFGRDDLYATATAFFSAFEPMSHLSVIVCPTTLDCVRDSIELPSLTYVSICLLIQSYV